MRDFYETSYANVHRGVYTLAERATAGYEGAREKVRAFVNAQSTREIIFTRSATEALNLVAYAWGLDNLGPGDLVVVTELEHHSNFVPWQYIAKRTGADFRDDPDRRRSASSQLDALDEHRARGQRQGRRRRTWSRTRSGRSTPSRGSPRGRTSTARSWSSTRRRPLRTGAVDVQALGCDFLAFSSHKMCGPTGVGALWGRAELLDADGAVQPRRPHDPLGQGRGHDLGRAAVQVRGRARRRSPRRTRFGAAIDYVSAIGLDAIEQHEHELAALRAGRGSPSCRASMSTGRRRPARGHRLVRRRRHPPARRRAGARLGGGRDPRGPPLHAAADDAPRRRRDLPRELLPLHRAGRGRPARSPASSRCRRSSRWANSTRCTAR